MNKPSLLVKLRNLFFAIPAHLPEVKDEPVRVKKALAIIVYDNHQQVTQLKNALNLHTQRGGFSFDIGVFQDGFDESRPGGVEAYNLTAAESLKLVDQSRFIRQDKHHGELAHRSAVEKFLFEELAYDVVLVLDQIDLPAGFFDKLSDMAEQLSSHPKVAGFTVSANPLQNSIANADSTQLMAYNRHAWMKTRGMVDAYTRLFNTPMEAYQKNVLLTWWLKNLGLSSPQITRQEVLRATHAALGYAEISVASSESLDHLMDSQLAQLSDAVLSHYVSDLAGFDRARFENRIASGDVHVNPDALVPIDRSTVFDLFSAYKFFLKRSPENFAVVESRVGASIELLFKDFLLSGEFLAQEVYWSTIVDAATKVIELNKAKQAAASIQTAQPAPEAAPLTSEQHHAGE
jgi:hypothetical protein